jgi:hypothetical protein
VTPNAGIRLTELMDSCADLLGTKLPDKAGAVVHHSGNGRFSLRQGNP